jgi:A/G-specific adenine glycosylase
MVNELPVKRSKKAPIDRYLHFKVPFNGGNTQIIKRGEGSIWAGLYEFPNEELDENSYNSLLEKLNASGPRPAPTMTHILSHQRIHAVFSLSPEPLTILENSVMVALEEMAEYPMSRLMTRFLDGFPIHELPTT